MILGVDISLANCGMAVVDRDGRVLRSFVYVLPTKDSKVYRRLKIVRVINKIHEETPLELVVMEEVRLFHQGGIALGTITDLAKLQASIEDWGYKKTVVTAVHTATWRKDVLGSGKSGKEESVAFVKQKYDRLVDHNEADAICQALWGARLLARSGQTSAAGTEPARPQKRRGRS